MSLCTWRIWLSLRSSKFVHVAACVRMTSFSWQNDIPLGGETTFCLSIHPWTFGLLDAVHKMSGSVPPVLPPIPRMTLQQSYRPRRTGDGTGFLRSDLAQVVLIVACEATATRHLPRICPPVQCSTQHSLGLGLLPDASRECCLEPIQRLSPV